MDISTEGNAPPRNLLRQQQDERMPVPSPLQINEMMKSGGGQTLINGSPKSPEISRMKSDFQYSPQSPRSNLAIGSDRPRSPQERSKELTSVDTSVNGNTNARDHESLRRTTASPPKAHSYSQLRNVSSPLPQALPLESSSPPSPRTIIPLPQGSKSLQPEMRPMPRTSSIDSAISSISLGTLPSHRPSQDSSASALPDVSSLIRAAGSPELVIHHLLKEKQHTAGTATQLWTLVEKQRALIYGLNQDLEKALKDKDRYRKKLKDYVDKVPPMPSTLKTAPVPQPVAVSRSPTPSEGSIDVQAQRQESEEAVAPELKTNVSPIISSTHSITKEITPSSSSDFRRPENTGEDWVRSKGRTQKDSKHSHKTTSSSDVGVFGPLKPSVAHIQTADLETPKGQPDSPLQLSPPGRPVVSPTASFTAKRSQPFSAKGFNGPVLALTESTPPSNDIERMTPPRKAPPAPLDLGQQRRDIPNPQGFGPEDHSGSDYDEDIEADELPAFERGRKKTREDDDKEREAVLLKQSQDRSQSKKAKSSKSRAGSGKSASQDQDKAAPQQTVPFTPSFKSFSPNTLPTGGSAFLAPPTSLASVLSPPATQDGQTTTEQVVSMKPMSPGLPLSPRPNHRPVNPPTPRLPRDGSGPAVASPPLSPRNGFVGLPLSPRSPRQPIPLPPQTPMSLISPRSLQTEPHVSSNPSVLEPTSPTKSPSTSVQTHSQGSPTTSSSVSSQGKGIYRGFVSESYPDLLLPPNALPSILVKVVSSRLRPSRQSLVLRGSDEEPVFTLGVSARADRQGLWEVERPLQSLHVLDQQLRRSSNITVKQPDRSLFSGHAPAKIDARRIALENYFETLLDTLMDETAALALCRYLSTQVSEPSAEEFHGVEPALGPDSPVTLGPNGKLVKEGYLTKRGKNFGGWKVRFFVLDDPVLRYYESPGGSALGTIKLQSAQIGKQTNKASYSPSRGDEEESDYRHAFLIREPKRRDVNSYVDHVLCAESDIERDSWVKALVCYVEVPGSDSHLRPELSKNESGSSKTKTLTKKTSLKKEGLPTDSPDSGQFNNLQAVPYENTQAAQAPLVQITPDPRPNESPSPTTSGSQLPVRAPFAQSKAISGPQNGAKIDDVGAWGNRPMASPLVLQKEQKKRSIWGFRDKNVADIASNHSNDSNLSLTQQQYQEQITNVKAAFGAPLAEAVEYCKPHGIDVCLPAVVYRCLEYLEIRYAASEEGIFRMSGSNTLIKNLRNRFNAEGDVDFLGNDDQIYDVHAVASLLKLYLRELPQPLLTRDLHLQFINVLDVPDKPKKVIAYNGLVHKLPKANFTLLRALSAFLITIVNNSDVNKMTIRNVGIVFSPTLNIPSPVFSMFLTEFDAIFGEPLALDDAKIPSSQVGSSEPLTPEDIHSPRKQMFSEIPTPSYTQNSFSNNNQQPYNSNNQAPTTDHSKHDTGFMPLQPSYDAPSQQGTVTVSGPEYAVARPRNLAPGGAAKARRRESSMIMMGSGQRKSSLPMMRDDADTLNEENTFA